MKKICKIFPRLFPTLHYNRRKFYYQSYIYDWNLLYMLCSWVNYLLLNLLSIDYLYINSYTLKKSSLLKVENNSSWISLISERKRTLSHLSWFSSAQAGEFTCIKNFIFKMKYLEWYKKHLIFAKWVIQNNSDALTATHIKWKKK